MPTYRYRDKQGELVEVFMTMAERDEREHDGILVHEGRTLTRDLAAEHGTKRAKPGAWPMACEAFAVMPQNRVKAMKQAQEMGVPTDYDHRGFAIVRDKHHYQRLNRAFGVHHKNGDY